MVVVFTDLRCGVIRLIKPDQVPVSVTVPGTRPVFDDVHSFVLRLHLNRAPDGRHSDRPQFSLEHVNSGTNRRMKNLDHVFLELNQQIDLILQTAK